MGQPIKALKDPIKRQMGTNRLTPEIMDYGDHIAMHFFRKFSNDFLLNSIDIDDLKQEAYFSMWKTAIKYSDKSDKVLKTLCGQSAFWRLKHLLGETINYEKVFTKIEFYNVLLNDTDNGELTSTFGYLAFNDNFEKNLMWNYLEYLLEPKEYQLLEMKYRFGLGMAEIGRKMAKDEIMGGTRENIRIKLIKIEDKLRKKLIKNYKEIIQ